MLFFTRKKLQLATIIPDNYVDIHSHLLPAIDDGAKDLDDTKNLIENLKKIGFSQLITTPHIFAGVWENTSEIIEENLVQTKEKLGEHQLRAAAEYMLDSHFFDRLKRGEKLLTLKENLVLIEISYLNAPIQLYDIIFEIQLQGYKPILAHPERYLFYTNRFDEYKKIKKAGCLFQLNLLATTGYYGLGVTKLAQKLLDANLYDFVGSDVHHDKHIKAFENKIQLKNDANLKAIIDNNRFFSL